MHTALCRVKIYDNLYCIWEIKKYMIKVNKNTMLEYGRLKRNYLFSTIKKILFQMIQLQFLFIM